MFWKFTLLQLKCNAIILQENVTCLNAETNFPRDKVTHIDLKLSET